MSITHGYYGRWKDCDCIVAVVIDDPVYPGDAANSVRDFIQRGYRVERLPIGSPDWRCQRHPKGTPPPWGRPGEDTR